MVPLVHSRPSGSPFNSSPLSKAEVYREVSRTVMNKLISYYKAKGYEPKKVYSEAKKVHDKIMSYIDWLETTPEQQRALSPLIFCLLETELTRIDSLMKERYIAAKS
jgi:hypothetical protein